MKKLGSILRWNKAFLKNVQYFKQNVYSIVHIDEFAELRF